MKWRAAHPPKHLHQRRHQHAAEYWLVGHSQKQQRQRSRHNRVWESPWSPFHNTSRTVIRAGFGMYNDLQDALGCRTDQNAPFNPTYSVPTLGRIEVAAHVGAFRPLRELVPGGVQPNMQTPTLISWSFRVEQEITANTVLRVGYCWFPTATTRLLVSTLTSLFR